MENQPKDLLETVEFVDVMQCYRIANPSDQSKVIRRFEEVKDWIRKNFIQRRNQSTDVKIDWQIERWSEKAESLAVIIGYDEAGNKYEGGALIIGSLLDGTIEEIYDYEMVKPTKSRFEQAIADTIEKPTRPDLSFITSQKFDGLKDYQNWYCNLTEEQRITVEKLKMKLPAFVALAEMQFDSMLGTPSQESLVFQVASETLNIK